MFYTEIQTIYLILTEAGGGTRKSFSESNVSDTELFLCETLLILLHLPACPPFGCRGLYFITLSPQKKSSPM